MAKWQLYAGWITLDERIWEDHTNIKNTTEAVDIIRRLVEKDLMTINASGLSWFYKQNIKDSDDFESAIMKLIYNEKVTIQYFAPEEPEDLTKHDKHLLNKRFNYPE